MALTKAELISAVAARSGETRTVVASVLEHLTHEVTAQLSANDFVVLSGIGKLAPVAKPARVGRNPATGADVQIAAKTIVKFTAIKALKDAVQP